MAKDPKLSWAGVNAALSGPGLGPALNSGYMRIFGGAIPANADDSLGAAVLLAELRLGNPAFGTAATGVMDAAAVSPDISADASGTPTFGRYYKSDGTTSMFQGTAGQGDYDFALDAAVLVQGQSLGCTAASISGARE